VSKDGRAELRRDKILAVATAMKTMPRRPQRGEAATTRHASSEKEARKDFEQKLTKEAK
jgi:hypothetical protein